MYCLLAGRTKNFLIKVLLMRNNVAAPVMAWSQMACKGYVNWQDTASYRKA
jgi:hypothetical protein